MSITTTQVGEYDFYNYTMTAPNVIAIWIVILKDGFVQKDSKISGEGALGWSRSGSGAEGAVVNVN